MRKTTITVGLIITMTMCLNSQVGADLVLGFSVDNGTTFSNDFNITTGDNLTIDIFARETSPNNELSSGGLVAFGFDLTSSPTGLGLISDATRNPLFDFENHNVPTATGFEWEYGESANTGIGNGGDGSVFLGNFQFNSTADGTTVFTIEDRSVGSGVGNANWITPTFDILDEQFFGPGAAGSFQFSINASAVPEPSTFTMCAGASMFFLMRRRRNAMK